MSTKILKGLPKSNKITKIENCDNMFRPHSNHQKKWEKVETWKSWENIIEVPVFNQGIVVRFLLHFFFIPKTEIGGIFFRIYKLT